MIPYMWRSVRSCHKPFNRFNAFIQKGLFAEGIDFKENSLTPTGRDGRKVKPAPLPHKGEVQADPVAPDPAVTLVDTAGHAHMTQVDIAAIFIACGDASPGDVLVQVVEQRVK